MTIEIARAAIEACARRSGPRRLLVAIAGAPGSGKSTFAEALADAIRHRTTHIPAVVAQDGFHLDNGVLDRLHLRARKGAPETFDVGGLGQLLERLRQGQEDVEAPTFDRALDRVRAAAITVPAQADIVIVEGNYLLLETPPWQALRPLFDLTILLTCTTATLHARLTDRWQAHGLAPDAAAARADGNDLVNARVVIDDSSAADLVIAND